MFAVKILNMIQAYSVILSLFCADRQPCLIALVKKADIFSSSTAPSGGARRAKVNQRDAGKGSWVKEKWLKAKEMEDAVQRARWWE